ncbi:hypothetical protein TH63_11045 [Rufibacter radiotolerans]|uniref:Uncharacterized protein n=1 Tax=Rufibacter radiotolerans TaxID=1379910 RepID=A0A0H4W6K3_9BACT|nr:hypothetical protein [Rufibacter radiotolerans]AKQ46056.1 hypothetical protein TH63_11045 [Rufibacter radiotolerans]
METEAVLGNNKNLKKAKALYRAILYLTAFTILMALLLPALKLEGTIRDLTISLPALLAVFITPVGFFFLIKSYRAKEPYKKQKLLYLVGYGFFITLFVLFTYAVAVDIAKLL